MVDAWATAADVLTYTGEEVGDPELLRAQDIVELFAGATYSATPNISSTNLRRLNRAVCYQAAWMQYHPDVYSNVDVDTVSQDGASHTPSHANAALLAPLALRHLKRLTWKLQPWRVRGRYSELDPTVSLGSLDSAAADDARVWVPL